MQWHQAHSRCSATPHSLTLSRTFSSSPKAGHPLISHTPPPPRPQPCQPLLCFRVIDWPVPDIRHKRHSTTCGPSARPLSLGGTWSGHEVRSGLALRARGHSAVVDQPGFARGSPLLLSWTRRLRSRCLLPGSARLHGQIGLLLCGCHTAPTTVTAFLFMTSYLHVEIPLSF